MVELIEQLGLGFTRGEQDELPVSGQELRRAVFDRVSLIPTGYGAYFIEFLYTCRKKGLTVHEMPFDFTDRTKGVSKSAPSLIRFAWTGLGYVWRILAARLRRL